MAEVQIDKLTVEIEADTTNATKGLDRLKKAMDNLSSKKAVSETNLLGGAFSNLLNKAKRLISIVAISRTLGKAIAKYSEYVEDINLFSVAMWNFADKGAELAYRMQELLGVDSGQTMKYMALFQNLTTSFGMAGDKAYILSSNLAQLGYDLASFHNLSIEESFQKLQAAISGELEPIRRLGVDIAAAFKNILHIFVTAHMSHYSEFNLTVVCIEKNSAFISGEKLSHLSAEFSSYWYILHIWLCR